MTGVRDDMSVVVVGAGLVGPVLAVALSRRGWPVQLIDTTPAARNPLSDTRPLALSQSSVRMLDALGLWRRVRAGATPIRVIHVSEAGQFAKVRLRAEQCGVEAFGYVVNAGDLAAAVQPAAEQASACTWTRNVTELAWCEAATGCAFEGLVDGEDRHRFSGQLAVLADSNPELVMSVPIKVEEQPYGQNAIACALQTSTPNKGVAYERFTRDGPVALLPLGPSRSGLVWSVTDSLAEELMALSEATFAERLRGAFGHWLGTLEVISKRASFPLSLGMSGITQTGLPLALVGNSALRPHPVAGQGLNLALRDVAVLCDVLGAAPDAGAPLDAVELGRTFMASRHDDRTRIRRLTHSLVKGFGSSLAPVQLARASALMFLSGAPALQRQFARIAMGLSTPQPGLVRGIHV